MTNGYLFKNEEIEEKLVGTFHEVSSLVPTFHHTVMQLLWGKVTNSSH